ncbi:MAG: hypothetical protein ACJAXH_001773 [Colwellia sp.]
MVLLPYYHIKEIIKMSITHINESTSKTVHKELLVALGSENNPQQWLEFMSVMRKHLPFLIGGTKPTKAHYEGSIIGALGFKSWADMVSSPVEDSGLNWSINTWNKWSQAYNVVLANPYLKDTELTYVQILKLKTTFKDDFPTGIESLEKAQSDLKEQKLKDKADNVTELKATVLDLERQLIAANAKLKVFESQQNDSKEQQLKLVEIEKSSAVLQSQCEQQEKENTKLSAELQESITEIKTLKGMGRFAHLARFFIG